MKRAISILIVGFILCFFLCSCVVLFHEADHDCTGEHCPVCAIVHLCQAVLRSVLFSETSPVLFAFSAFLFLPFCLRGQVLHFPTPVFQNVRMDE